MTTRTITISDADIAALKAIRGVVADAAHHPGRQAAIEAIDRLTEAGHAFSQFIGYCDPSPPVHDTAYLVVTPESTLRGPFSEIAALYGLDELLVTRCVASRSYRVRAQIRGRVRHAIISDADLCESPLPTAPWFQAIRDVAFRLGIEGVGTKDAALVEILTRWNVGAS